MAHIAIASDLSYEVFKLRSLKGELGPGSFDSSHRHLHQVSGYRAFVPDVEDTLDQCRPHPLVAAAILGGDESDTD
jgi:hypothetical protein